MKICPQCKTAYPEDYVFCLTDGNTLHDESGEQDTMIRNRIVFPEKTSALSPDMFVACVSCGLANRANSKFCKKCGTPLTGQSPSGGLTPPASEAPFGVGRFHSPAVAPLRSFPSSGPDQMVAFQPSTFTPPQSIQTDRSPHMNRQRNIAVITVLACVLIVIAALVFNSQTATNKPAITTASTPSPNRAANTASTPNTVSNVPVTNAPPVSAQSVIGRTGRLTTNLQLHSGSTKYDEIVGTHYEGARIQVLDAKSYDPGDGVVTWYKVRVVENGFDRKTGHGKGNNWERNGNFGWMEANMEGWMNSKYIVLE